MQLKRGRLTDMKAPPSNPSASPEARLLYARMLNQFGARAGSERPFFTGTNETAANVPYYRTSGIRIQALTGKQPLFKCFWAVGQGNPAYPDLVAAVKEHHRAGGICGAIWHPKNYLTGGNNYDRSRDDWDAVLACKVGGSKIAEYRADLDLFANIFNNDLVDDNGKRIPFFVRIGNETNGWYDYPDMSVTSLTRSGTTATMHFARGANPLANAWGNFGAKFQLRGASDAKWNKIHSIVSYVKDGDSNGGTVTFTVTDSPTSNPAGTLLTYPLAGDWWAGLDRAPDVLELWRQTIDYLRDIKGCNQLLWGPDIFTNNRLAFSMNPANIDPKTGLACTYRTWLTGMESYWDFVSTNLYQDEPLTWAYCDFGAADVVNAFQTLADWCEQYQRPLFFYEYGALYYAREAPDFWSTRCMDAFDAKYPSLAGACTWTAPVFLPDVGTPAGNDFAVGFNKSRYRWLGQ